MSEKPAQEAALPNPMFTYSGMDMAAGGHFPDTNERYFMIQQEFPWFGKRGLREAIAGKDAETARRELESAILDVVMRVKESGFDLYATRRSIAITRDEADVLQRVAKMAESLSSTGDRSQQDVLKARTEITMLKQKLLELQTQEATLKAMLNTLLDRRPDAPLSLAMTAPPTNVEWTVEQLLAVAAATRPELQSARVQVERYELDRRLMARESFPDYKLGVEYRDFVQGEDMIMFTIGIDLPIWRSKYRAGEREAERMRDSSLAARDAAERQISFEVQDAWSRFVAARRTLDLYRMELIPQAEARFSASEAGYRTGKVDFLDLLESQRFLLNARVMAAMAEGTLGMQLARLERAAGGDLKRLSPKQQAASTQGAHDAK
jgi:outer membrane protein TolC